MTKKIVEKINKLVKETLSDELSVFSEEIIEFLMRSYDVNLIGVVTDRKSKTDPALYRDEFYNRLKEFDFVIVKNGQVTLRVPDMENFDWRGRLEVVQTILEGVSGKYYEVTADDYRNAMGKLPVSKKPLDKSVPLKDKLYLVRSGDTLRRTLEKRLDKGLVLYPFSNTHGLDRELFDEAEKFVDSELPDIINTALKKALKEAETVIK